MSDVRVLILHNDPVLPPDHPHAESEREVLEVVEVVDKYLVEGGFEVSRLAVSHDPAALLQGLSREEPDVVFNLFEGTGDDGSNEASVAGLLEWMNIPFTGCPSRAMMLARDKPLAKRLLRGAGLPSPEFDVIESLPAPECRVGWPVIVKPAMQDASVGLDEGSIVSDPARLEKRVAWVLERYGAPVLVERFIPGREFNVGVIEIPSLRSLPVAEIEFSPEQFGQWGIVTYNAKWVTGCAEDLATPRKCPANVVPALSKQLQELALAAFRLLGCRDYARVDFRASPAGQPFILEVNPNPDFHPTCGFAGGLEAAGLSHAQFTVDLVNAARARRRPLVPAYE